MLPKGFVFKPWRYSKFDSPTNPGSPIKKVYSGRYDKNGDVVLDEVGEENVYETIQSYAAECDINNIIRRYMAGDVDVLSRVQGFYFDASELPDNMPEVLNKLNYAEEEFNKLPIDFKERYGNDFVKFLTTFDDSVFADLVGHSNAPSVPVDPQPIEKDGVSDES